MEELSVSTSVGLAGFAIGVGFGALTNWSNFCTMGAVADAVSFGDYRRARAWALAIAIAIFGAQLLQAGGLIDLNQSFYMGANFNWLGSIFGGLIFGFGMVLASGCPGRNLARAGSGDLRALMVLIIIGLFSYMTLRGIIGVPRVALEQATSIDLQSLGLDNQGFAAIIAVLTGTLEVTIRPVLAAIVVLLLLWFCFRDSAFRTSPRLVLAGIGIGGLVTAGWWATGILGADEFEPVQLESLTFAAPSGNSLQYLMTYTGATISFGVAVVGGALAGAFLSALIMRRFAVSTFSGSADTVRHLVGAAFMGTGGVAALGCTIGQGISGMSTLALGSAIVLTAIVTGGVIGLKYLEWALDI